MALYSKVNCAILSPVGTSLLQNYSRNNKNVVEELGLEGWEKFSPSDIRQNIVCENMDRLATMLVQYVVSSQKASSAEANSVLEAIAKYGCNPETTNLVLYANDTCTSRLVAMSLESGFKQILGDKLEVHTRIFTGVRPVEAFSSGMEDLAAKVADDVRIFKKRGFRVLINATPGFKAESGYMLLAGALAGADRAFYIHESFRSLVDLPLPPLSVDDKYCRILSLALRGSATRESLTSVASDSDLELLASKGLLYKAGDMYVASDKWFKVLCEK